MTHAKLFEPVRFRCGAEMRNRLALAPLTNQQSHEDGTLSDDERRWLVRRAAGGFGLVSTCAAHVSPDGKGFEGQLGVWGDHQLPGLTRLASEIAAHGALGVVQLYHGGVRSPSKLTGQRPWSASEFHEDRPDYEAPRAATEDDIARVIKHFGEAAARAERAGFAGVELHAAHGYLLSQFLSATMNTRADSWGGDLANRSRLVREVTRAARSATRPGFLVGVRLSPEDFAFTRGVDLDETVSVARALADDGADYIHLSLWDVRRNTKKRPDSHAIPLFRAALPADVRVFAAGKVWDVALAEATLAQGADVIALGRAAIVNPEWPALARDGVEPRRPPLTVGEYAERDVSASFAGYLRRFDGMVKD